MVTQCVVGRVPTLLRKDLGDQPVAWDDAICAEQQQREQRTLLRAPECDRGSVHTDGKRAEDPELETARGHLRPKSSLPKM
jgi:hypothetical protein